MRKRGSIRGEMETEAGECRACGARLRGRRFDVCRVCRGWLRGGNDIVRRVFSDCGADAERRVFDVEYQDCVGRHGGSDFLMGTYEKGRGFSRV